MSHLKLPDDFAKLTERDEDLIRTLRTHCRQEGITKFSSDTLRMLGLDRFFSNPSKEIGAFFARVVRNDVAEQVDWKRSELRSNHGRKIRVYEWCDDAEDRMRRDLIKQP